MSRWEKVSKPNLSGKCQKEELNSTERDLTTDISIMLHIAQFILNFDVMLPLEEYYLVIHQNITNMFLINNLYIKFYKLL